MDEHDFDFEAAEAPVVVDVAAELAELRASMERYQAMMAAEPADEDIPF